ncbi:hypothetical protein [Pseudomonas chlororaphis]|uniref:hypothetical protein n=1 Tax=Pseudomonas chlororaphis TaxID=587753 RepID=UPI000F56C140|nr:hypothetical protein [Pseudomonas chlororaphis]AZC83997.1 hypothetical protein C4K30_4905 [Pseudomonas chlororaphis subsp. piscium]
MLTSSHSSPNLNTINSTNRLPNAGDTPAEKPISSGSAIFSYNSSAASLAKVDNIANRLKEPTCELDGSSLELISLALINDKNWPKEISLAYQYYADTKPCTVFSPCKEKNWVNFETLPEPYKMQSIEIHHDGKGTYSATNHRETWKASGEDAFFKIMLAIKSNVTVDTISDKQATEFRRDLSKNILDQRPMLSMLWQNGPQDQIESNDACAIAALKNATNNPPTQPIRLEGNPRWINPETRSACKYSPVNVTGLTNKDTIKTMQEVLNNRIGTCRELALDRDIPGNGSWFSFIRSPQLHEPHLNKGTVPAIVISGGSANKLAAELSKDYSLAWHPKNMKSEHDTRADPVYLLVHKLDYPTYKSVMREAFEQYPNLHLIGWDGGKLTGFGAARASALAFADTLPYRPERIMMIDQDVVKTEQTRHTNPTVRNNVENLHQTTKQPIAGYGIGYPTRQSPPLPFRETLAPGASDLNGPAEQFVSIQAPFRRQGNDGIYPAYMVAGGEDMLMSKELGLSKEGRNIVQPEVRIIKKELKGSADVPNTYWNEGRAQTLRALFEAEKNTLVEFEDQKMSLDGLMSKFKENGWISAHPSVESYNVSACIIERIILRLNKELAKNET